MATPASVVEKEQKELAGINANYEEKFGFHDPETGYAYKSPKGLSREVVESISEYKSEPQWMRDFRIKAYEHFESRPTPAWGGNLGQIDWNDIHYFVRASEKNSRDWSEVPDDIKKTFDSSGSPRPSASSWPGSAPSTSPRSSTTRCARTSRSRVSCSWTWTRDCASTRTSCASTSRR